MGNPDSEPVLRSPVNPDVLAVARITAVPDILRLVCESTGMGFSAVARVTDESWTACAVHDAINFGLAAGGALDLQTTLCFESRAARQPIVVDDFATNPFYRDHHTPRIYGLKSYISVPIVLPDGTYFGNLCAIDPRPAQVSNSRTLAMFESFASLIACQLAAEQSRRSMESELREEKAVSGLREQFIAVLGHDLRNPLSAISATAYALQRRRDDPALNKTGSRLTATVQRMSRLIDDLLDFARGRLGSGMPLRLTRNFSLEQELRAVVEELRLAHPEGDIADEIRISREVICDQARIQQLLSNLLANAITHGLPGGVIHVSASIEESACVICVRNGGEPIPSENLSKLFEPYWRPDSKGQSEGLGLGLYICDQIVKAHGGTLQVRSTVEEGTCFMATIPTSGGTPPALPDQS